MALTDKLTAIGDAIREKEGSTGLIALSDMPSRIQALSTGGDNDPVRKSVLALMNDSAMVDYVVPAGVTKIPEYMFSNRTKLKDLVYEDESLIKEIGQGAFSGASNLKLTKFPSGFTATSLPYACFQQCGSLTLEEGLPDCIKEISPYAFETCTDLQFNTLPASLETISANAFRWAFSQYNTAPDPLPPEMFIIPAKVKTIGLNAFYGVGLKKVRFLGTPTSIDSQAFYGSTITDIYVPWLQTQNVGAVAPWGATNATVHYNVSPDEVIS